MTQINADFLSSFAKAMEDRQEETEKNGGRQRQGILTRITLINTNSPTVDSSLEGFRRRKCYGGQVGATAGRGLGVGSYLTDIDSLSLHVTCAKSEAEALEIGKGTRAEEMAAEFLDWQQSEWDFEGWSKMTEGEDGTKGTDGREPANSGAPICHRFAVG